MLHRPSARITIQAPPLEQTFGPSLGVRAASVTPVTVRTPSDMTRTHPRWLPWTLDFTHETDLLDSFHERDASFVKGIVMSYAPDALLDAARKAGDRTPADMARRMKVPYLAAYRWATGRHAPSPSGLAAIERTYGLTSADLMREDAAA